MKKIAAIGVAGVLTLMMGTSVLAAGSAAVSGRGTATGGLIVHHAEYFGGHFNHVGLPDCSLSNQFCRTATGYSLGAQVTEAPVSSGGQQVASGQTYTQGNSGSYGSGSQGYGGNYTDTNSNGVCDNWENGSCYGNGYGSGQGYGGGHHSGGHRGGCRR